MLTGKCLLNKVPKLSAGALTDRNAQSLCLANLAAYLMGHAFGDLVEVAKILKDVGESRSLSESVPVERQEVSQRWMKALIKELVPTEVCRERPE